jgi:hypothetical protein
MKKDSRFVENFCSRRPAATRDKKMEPNIAAPFKE